MKKVILISIDGLRPDGALQCGHPFVQEMMQKGSYALSARTVLPSVTLPCHLTQRMHDGKQVRLIFGRNDARCGIVLCTRMRITHDTSGPRGNLVIGYLRMQQRRCHCAVIVVAVIVPVKLRIVFNGVS